MQRRTFLASTGTTAITVLAGCSLDPADSYEGDDGGDIAEDSNDTVRKGDDSSEVESANKSSPGENGDALTHNESDEESDTDGSEDEDDTPENSGDELDVIESEGESDNQRNANDSDEESDADGLEGDTPENSGDELDIIESEEESDE